MVYIKLKIVITIGDGMEDMNGYGTIKPKNLISSILGGTPGKPKLLAISQPHDFRQVKKIKLKTIDSSD